MRISELARKADVTITTVKFYLDQGLLPQGEVLSRTRMEYTEAQLNRLRLIRALVDVAGLSLNTVRELLTILDERGAVDAPVAPVVPAKKRRLKADVVLAATHEALPPEPPLRQREPHRARAAVSALGWQVEPDSVALGQLEGALIALDIIGLPPTVATLLTYGEAAQKAASADIASLPTGPGTAIARHLVLGTAIHEPMLVALHRLAQQNALNETKK